MSVYKKEFPEYFDLAMESIYNQTFKKFEVVLVADGPLTEGLYGILNKWKNLFGDRMKIVHLKENRGLANALNAGLEHCSFDLVARMDSDDYSAPNRLELQYNFMEKHPEIDVLGSYMAEFFNDQDKPSFIKQGPIRHEDIVKNMWLRNPINHVTVMLRKGSVLKVGKYDSFYGDDDYLWARMWIAGYKFHNMPEYLVRVRIGNEMYKRRGGLEVFLSDFRVRKFLFKNGKMNFLRFIFSSLFILVIRLSPPIIKKFLYSKDRKKIE